MNIGIVMSVSEKNIEKLQALAWVVAVADGISEEEADSLEMLTGQIGRFYPLRKAVEVLEKTGDIDKAMAHVSQADAVGTQVMVHTMTFGSPEHIRKMRDEFNGLTLEDSENPWVEYETFLKIKASDITDEFDQKLALIFIEQAIKEDGISSDEMRALLVLSRSWGISRRQADSWFADHFDPICERAKSMFEGD